MKYIIGHIFGYYVNYVWNDFLYKLIFYASMETKSFIDRWATIHYVGCTTNDATHKFSRFTSQ